MIALPIVILLTFIIIILKTILYTPRVDYKCFLLTLKSSNERSRKFLDSYDDSIPLEIVYGDNTKDLSIAKKYSNDIDPKYYRFAIKTHYDKNAIRPNITYFNLGAIGCFFGHMNIYERCFKQRLKYALVFEDNVIIKHKNLFDEVQRVIDELGDDFELCFFHCISRLPESTVSETGLERVKWISSTKCYLIHVDNMRTYYGEFYPMDNHVDMKHEDLIAKGARVYYKDLRHCMKIDRSHSSTIGHSDWKRRDFFSKVYPDATTDLLEYGY